MYLLLIYTPVKALRYDIHVFVLCVCLYDSVCFCGMAVITTYYLEYLKLLMGINFVSDVHGCNTFCPVLQKLVDVGLKTF